MTAERPLPAPVTAIPYELRIGVTGHRDIADEAAVRHAVDNLLEHIDETLRDASANPYGGRAAPASRTRLARWWLAKCVSLVWRKVPVAARRTPPDRVTPIDWTVISPLAVGADRIAAEAVLDNERIHGNRRLEAMLPFEQEEYERDFRGEGRLEPFRKLLERAARKTVVTKPYPGRPGEPGRIRDDAYLKVGRAVVDACEILIAVWDGEREPDSVGTPGIVDYALSRGAFVYWIDSNNPAAPVRRLVSIGDASPTQDPDSAATDKIPWTAEPVPDTATDLSPGFHRLSAYNRDPAIDAVSLATTAREEAEKLRKAATKSHLPNDCIDPLIDTVLTQRVRADELAKRYQKLYKTTAKLLYGLAAVAVTIPVLQVLFLPHHPGYIVFEVLALLVILVLLTVGRSEAWHEKWLQDRHLAERLRIALFVAAVDVSDPDRRMSLEPLVDYYGKIGGWTDNVVTRLTHQASQFRCDVGGLAPLRDFVSKAWIEDQIEFHRGASARHERERHAAHGIGLVLFLITFVAASLHALGIGHAEDLTVLTAWVGLGFALAAFSIALPAWGVAVHAIDAMLDRERMAARSAGMARILQLEVRRDIEEATSFESLREAVGRAASLMSRENYEWLTALAFHKLHRPG